jgi:hypothetical protein
MEARLSESCSMVDSSEMEHGSKAVRIRIGFHKKTVKIKQNVKIDFLEINKACIILYLLCYRDKLCLFFLYLNPEERPIKSPSQPQVLLQPASPRPSYSSRPSASRRFRPKSAGAG